MENKLETYKQNIIKYNGNENVIKNMLLAACIHDTEHNTNYCEELENWLNNGKVYEEPNCRVKVNDGSYHSIVGWSQEDYGTFVEYDTRWGLEILRKYVYALDNQGRVAKYKIIETEHKNKIKQCLYGSYDTYELVSYFEQTKVGVKPTKQGFTYDKNGKLISTGEKQTKFSEIIEYDVNKNILSIYRKNEQDRINEYEPDGKTLRTYHVTQYLPYLQWSENENKTIFKTIDEFEAKLFDR